MKRAWPLLLAALACESPRPGSPATDAGDTGAPTELPSPAPVGGAGGGPAPSMDGGGGSSADGAPTDTPAPPADGPWMPSDAPVPSDAPAADSATPPEPPGSDRPMVARQLALGAAHSCALLTDGTVRCWGNNYHGQLGRPATDAPQTRPRSVLGLTGVRAIAAGNQHSCALMADGTVMCWGWNVNGQLGNGSFANAAWPDPARKVMGVTGASAIAAGGDHNCAVAAGGPMLCWGGIKPTGGGDWNVPSPMPGVGGASALAVSELHRCAIVAGAARCWGSNRYGQLGDGNMSDDLSGVVDVRNLTGVSIIVAGNSSTCAAAGGGALHCWGLGIPVLSPDGGFSTSALPMRVPQPSGVVGLAVGGFHGCALGGGGTIWCWGNGVLGALGTGDEISRNEPTPVVGLSNAVAVAAGYRHNCAIVNGGAVHCWGYNSHGQLGNGASGSSTLSPMPVAE